MLALDPFFVTVPEKRLIPMPATPDLYVLTDHRPKESDGVTRQRRENAGPRPPASHVLMLISVRSKKTRAERVSAVSSQQKNPPTHRRGLGKNAHNEPTPTFPASAFFSKNSNMSRASPIS